jgi:hypothetical protein
LQCVDRCCQDIWPSEELIVDVDEATIRATSPLPVCLRCGGLARPNILMFGDWDWRSQRSDDQALRYADWLRRVRDSRLVVIELGAGPAVPTVRRECERRGGRLIRINPRDPQVPEGGISLPLGALQALQRIEELMENRDEAK